MISMHMQSRAGLLFLSKTTGKVLLIFDNDKWSAPTFIKSDVLLEDCKQLFDNYHTGKILPIELYLSEDKKFEYGTYICVVDKEFIPNIDVTFLWGSIDNLPKNLHNGLKNTLNNSRNKTKIQTILEMLNA